jgi:HEAT repeat protein
VTREGRLIVAAIVIAGVMGAGGPTLCVLPGASPGAGVHAAGAGGGQRPFEEVTRDLRSEDPKIRVAAMRSLAAASYPEAMAPIAALLADPVNEVQLEAIDTLLSFVVVERVATSRRVALVVEVRDAGGAQAVFDMGPFVLIPRPVVPEVVAGLGSAMRDDHERVRVEATYALGVLARPVLDAAGTQALVAAMSDPKKDVRLAAVRVAGGLRVAAAGEALIAAINDKQADVRMAAMRAVGDVKETRGVQALREQFEFYEAKGPYAQAALDGLARVASPDPVPIFQTQLTSKDPLLRRYAAEGLARSGSASLSLPTLDTGVASEKDEAVALAFAYALQSAGRPTIERLVGALSVPRLEGTAMLYLTELGQPIASPLGAYLQSGDERTREDVAMVLGLLGGADALEALERAKQDPNTNVARAVERAIARARMGR